MFDLDEFLHHFERVRERTRRVAACIPAERVEWTYKVGAFTLGDLVRHIAVTERSSGRDCAPSAVAYRTHGASCRRRDAVLSLFDRLHGNRSAVPRADAGDARGEMRDARDAVDDVEMAEDDAGARDSSPRTAAHDARDAERADAAALRHDGCAGKGGSKYEV
jgi:hypothetical protein